MQSESFNHKISCISIEAKLGLGLTCRVVGEKNCALVSVWSLQWSVFAVSESESPLSLSLSLSLYLRTLICKQPLLCEMCDNLWKN
jgi:hypothetical protein